MKIGIFGGAFNPIHNGHINLAKNYINSLSLDKLILVPTAIPPHRNADNLESKERRIKMLNLAFEDEGKVEISDIEFRLLGKSYTYNTVMELKKIYTDAEFYLIIGSDQFLNFDKWYNSKELLQNVVLCTAPRKDFEREKIISFSRELGIKDGDFFVADFEPINISSSEIRENIKDKTKISNKLPEKVYNYILENGLYGV